MVRALDAELVEAAVAQPFARLTETAAESADRRPMLVGEIAEARRREQRHPLRPIRAMVDTILGELMVGSATDPG